MGTLSARLAVETGNGLTLAGPMEDDIPATLEYNRMSTALSAVFRNALLVRPAEVDRIDYRAITRFDPRALGLIGVRYVCPGQRRLVPIIRMVREQAVLSRPGANLYEIIDVNHGQYSPPGFASWGDIADALGALSDSDFDPRRDALAHSFLPPSRSFPRLRWLYGVSATVCMSARARLAGRSSCFRSNSAAAIYGGQPQPGCRTHSG
jgi:hypothetical protein